MRSDFSQLSKRWADAIFAQGNDLMEKDEALSSHWPSAEDYGNNYRDLTARIKRGMGMTEYHPDPAEAELLRHGLVKLAMAAEDIRRAISLVEQGHGDDLLADAIVELENACREVSDSYQQIQPALVRLLNFLSA